jgi:hypothetical protein
MTFCLTGLDIEEKAALVERTFWARQGGRDRFQQAVTQLIRTDKADPATNEEGVAVLRFVVKDPDDRKVGRAFSSAGVEMALSSYPGMFGTGSPGGAEPYGVYWPALVPADLVPQYVELDDVTTTVAPITPPPPAAIAHEMSIPVTPGRDEAAVAERTVRVPLGRVIGARSGDKGGNANLGLWARSDDAFSWLHGFLTVDRLQTLLPEAQGREVTRHVFANLRALNFVLVGLLEEGVAASTRMDGQAKSLGEYLRARVVDVPVGLVPARFLPSA